jgi:hypothetical protein
VVVIDELGTLRRVRGYFEDECKVSLLEATNC